MKEKISPTQKMLNVWALILIVWALYRANFKMPEWFDEFVAKPMVFILPVYYFIKMSERKKFFASVWFFGKSLGADVAKGVGIGGIFFLSALAAQLVKYKKIVLSTPDTHGSGLLLLVGLAFATAISEEILSRGFVLKRLYEESKNMYTSSFIASILFFFLHIPILFASANIGGNMLLVLIATDMLLSFITSIVYLKSKSLVPAILIHALYNLSIVLFI